MAITSTLLLGLAWAGEPVIAPHAHAEVGVVVREAPLDQPGVDVAVPPAPAAGVGAGLVGGRLDAPARGWLDLGMVTSLAGRAIETLDDGSSRIRPGRSQMARASFGVLLAPRPGVMCLRRERARIGHQCRPRAIP